MVKGSEVLLDDAFPHGTPAGYDRGCRGGACPAAIPCRDVKRRYGSDMDFRRLVDAGVSLAEIVSIDQAAAERDAILERNKRRAALGLPPLPRDKAEAAPAGVPKPSPPARRPADLVRPVPEVDEAAYEEVMGAAEAMAADLVAENDLLDADGSPACPRKWAARKAWVAIAPGGALHGPFDDHAQTLVFISAQFPATMPIPPAAESATRAPRPLKRFTEDEIATARRLWRDGATDRAIAKALGRPRGSVSQKLRALGLATNGTRFGDGSGS